MMTVGYGPRQDNGDNDDGDNVDGNGGDNDDNDWDNDGDRVENDNRTRIEAATINGGDRLLVRCLFFFLFHFISTDLGFQD
jgi:hypothetical protein